MQAPMAFRTAEVELASMTIKLDDAHTSAQVGARALLVATTREGERRSDRRAVDFRLAKTDGRWRITSVTVWPTSEAAP